jgi:hypothetical protein
MDDTSSPTFDPAKSDGSAGVGDAETWPVVVPVDDIQHSDPTVTVMPRPAGIHINASYTAQTPWSSFLLKANFISLILLIVGGVIGCYFWLNAGGGLLTILTVIVGLVLLIILDVILMMFTARKVDDAYTKSQQ